MRRSLTSRYRWNSNNNTIVEIVNSRKGVQNNEVDVRDQYSMWDFNFKFMNSSADCLLHNQKIQRKKFGDI